VALDHPSGDWPRDQGAADHGKRRRANADQFGIGEPRGRHLARPGKRRPRPANERQAADQHAVAGMRSPGHGDTDAGQVLQHQQQHRHGTQNRKWLAAVPQRRELGREPDGREEHKQQDVARALAELELGTAQNLSEKAEESHDRRADHGIGNVDPL